ncbi:family 78 glycoside hydrolase catalytic domain [Actinopolymorpha alba]|uniref:family 78 glycoside hydrolase catalytic domain n=1 Tax=Actinopolymorpha alba TaxID=533267 RepID=UPI0003A73EEC|nr:family 78 glycoside hydrolase catalytic domain [Actinopolymorpha alba]
MGEVSRRGVLGGMAGTALSVFPSGVLGGRADAVPPGREVGAPGSRGSGPPDGIRGPMKPVGLTTDHLVNPLGMDAVVPRFGWRLVASGENRAQSAYRIMVASTRERAAALRPDVWDSGRVNSAEQTARGYAGPQLTSRTRYFWTVRVWDEAGMQGPLSEVAWFETALLSQDEWTADWIGSGIVVPPPPRVLPPRLYEATALLPGHTLGQSFESESSLVAVTVLLEVPAKETASCELTLRRDDPSGEVVARAAVSNLVGDRYGNAQGRLDLPEVAPPGTYYLELSEPWGSIGWLGLPYDSYDGGSAHTDGSKVAGDRWVYGIPPNPPANPLLRKEFSLATPVVSARLHIVGLGHSVAWINGKRVGDAQLTPPATDYDRRVLYSTYDVTTQVRQGVNAIGVALGRGFFATRAPDTDGSNLVPWMAEPRLRAQLEVTLAGGRRITVRTGGDWRLTEGPTTYDGVYSGETYDARRAARLAGWTSPGFDSSGWRSAAVVDAPEGRLQAYPCEPLRAGEPIRPVAVRQPVDGVRVYDFGAVRAGWVRLGGTFPAGTTVRLLASEKIGSSGRIEVGTPAGNENASVDGRFQVDEYIAAGGGEETWQPSFTYKGFRYVEVTGTTQPLDLAAIPVGSDLASTMDLRVDNRELQWIADAVRQTTRNGLQGHPVISPMFTKLGWTGGTFRAVQPMLYQFRTANLFATWLDDIRLAQAPDGEIPLIVPQGELSGGLLLTPTSTGVYPYLVRRYWLTYGDRTVPEKHFDGVRRYVEWLLGKLQDGIADDPFGDWYPPRPGDTPAAPEGGTLVATAYVIETLRDAVALAELVGATEPARAWRTRTESLVQGFNQTFLDVEVGHYRTSVDAGYRQTSNAVPLAFGLVPATHVDAVVAGLVRDVEAKDRHLDTGGVGTGALPYALSDHGRADLAHAVLTQRDYPSYGYLRGLGATTLWESWEASSRGHNDPTLSAPLTWLVERVLGVELLEPGWRRFRIAPRAFGALRKAEVSLDTVRGQVATSWERSGHELALEVRVPVNAVAEVTLPNGEERELGSGHHHFVAAI